MPQIENDVIPTGTDQGVFHHHSAPSSSTSPSGEHHGRFSTRSAVRASCITNDATSATPRWRRDRHRQDRRQPGPALRCTGPDTMDTLTMTVTDTAASIPVDGEQRYRSAPQHQRLTRHGPTAVRSGRHRPSSVTGETITNVNAEQRRPRGCWSTNRHRRLTLPPASTDGYGHLRSRPRRLRRRGMTATGRRRPRRASKPQRRQRVERWLDHLGRRPR